MNYLLLPPGLIRRMAYSNYLANRRRRGYNFLRISPIRRNREQIVIFNYESLSQLEDVKIGLISKNILNKTQVKLNINTEENNNFCVICQEDIENNSIIREIHCKHSFHINCIDNWLVDNKKCPMCKYEI